MGKLINGEWITEDKLQAAEDRAYQAAGGKFQREDAGFRHWVTGDGKAGPTGEGGFKAEAGRYHLIAAWNCPWAHRTLLYRNVKQLQDIVSLSFVLPLRNDQGWAFDDDQPRFSDNLYHWSAVHQYYSKAALDYTGSVTVPVLWDKQQQTIVSNESAEIIRMFNSAFNDISVDTEDFYPSARMAEIDELNDFILKYLNNGVYMAGFARTQAAYDEAVVGVFDALDAIEDTLSQQRYLLGDSITESDWRLLPTLFRFDVAYHSAFKCNLRALRDYPHLSAYLKAFYQHPGVAETVDLDIYRLGYHSKSELRNPLGIIPIGPEPDFI